MRRKAKITGAAIALLATVTLLYFYGRGLWVPMYLKIVGQRTVAEVIASVGPDARNRMSSYFSGAGVAYPPSEVTLLAIKDAAQLEVWAGSEANPTFIHRYEIKALSGVSGPKLREGDRQVPEGFYQIELLNPNSNFYLSMKLNYPNSFDLINAKAEGRSQPGTNIFIHGKALSVGCLAMGDEAIEELFTLVHDVGLTSVQVVIAPTDPRVAPISVGANSAWVTELYRALEDKFQRYALKSNDL